MTSSVATYEIKRTFRAPLDFAFSWCTDYTPDDRKLQGEHGSRQILRKTSRTAVYEDLTPTEQGWMWSRQSVTLHPPDRWHATAVGNYRTWVLDYSLRKLGELRTEFTMRGRRRATPLGVRNPPKAELESELHTMWRNLGAALERDYRATRRKKAGLSLPISPGSRGRSRDRPHGRGGETSGLLRALTELRLPFVESLPPLTNRAPPIGRICGRDSANIGQSLSWNWTIQPGAETGYGAVRTESGADKLNLSSGPGARFGVRRPNRGWGPGGRSKSAVAEALTR